MLHAGFKSYAPGVILHISHKMGTIDSRSGYEKQVHITNCSRVAEDWHVYTGAGYDEWEPREIVKAVEHTEYAFLFCRKCGSNEDFQRAIDGYWEFRDAEMARRDVMAQIERGVAKVRRVQMNFELQRFLGAYVTADAPLHQVSNYEFSYNVPNSGVIITVKAEWEDDK
ncbi:MAG: hypothetical protein AMJ53_16715 [Gammaproteobacteria bacterium SG8_11]|nr:MAG: hypothetical protein AMJ53_16715 [Gammaproteobacteria bacterium SG8_11]